MIEFTNENFDEVVLKTDKLVMVDVYAEWCGPCKVITPIIHAIAEDYKETIIVGKVNVDNCPYIASKYNIRNVPTILFIKHGEVITKKVGSVQKKQLTDVIDKLLQD